MLCCEFCGNAKLLSIGYEKNLIFLHGFASILSIIARKFNFLGKLAGNFEKKFRESAEKITFSSVN